MSQYQYITYEVIGKTALITFNRPEVFNAMNIKTKLEIIEAIKTSNKDQAIRTIVLTGAGKAFSAGQDLNDRTVQAGNGPVDLGNTLKTEWNPLIEAIRNSQKIVIAAINGVCAGAGLSVALACDLKVSKPGTKFVSGFAHIGLCPDAGTSFLLSRHLGYSRALEFSLLGKPLLAGELLEAGLINEVSEDEKASALKMAEIINSLAPKSVELIKKNLQFGYENDFNDTVERETYSQRFLGWTEDYKEGVAAFLEKRKAEFKGL